MSEDGSLNLSGAESLDHDLNPRKSFKEDYVEQKVQYLKSKTGKSVWVDAMDKTGVWRLGLAERRSEEGIFVVNFDGWSS